MFYLFSFPPGVSVVTLNLIASNPGPSILTLYFDADFGTVLTMCVFIHSDEFK